MEKWFAERLVKWYRKNARDLPWRNTRDPYKIWLSEIILQQTQVKQGLSYYEKFVAHYPTVSHLAKAPEDKVLKDWQGLGYYSRARNLHAAAKLLLKEHKGKFPENYDQIRSLKGVGDYTAAAIASFAFGQPQAVVDGNVYRLLSRLFGIDTPIDSTAGKKQFRQLAEELLDKKSPALHNQAIMEFGSQYCRPVKPDCEQCIFRDKCLAFAHSQVEQLPVKAKKTKVTERYLHYLVLLSEDGKIWVNKRSDNDIWKGLYEFVLIENSRTMTLPEIKSVVKGKLSIRSYKVLQVSGTYKHLLSHRTLYADFYVLRVNNIMPHDHGKWVDKKGFVKLAFPRLIEKFIKDCKLDELF